MKFQLELVKQELIAWAEGTLGWHGAEALDLNSEYKWNVDSLLAPEHHRALQHPSEKLLLLRLSQSLDPGSRVLELGTFLGGTASILARANPSIEVIAVDNFSDYHWQMGQTERFIKYLGTDQRTEAALKQSLADIPNLTIRAGHSPNDFYHTDLRDFTVILDDSDHFDMGISINTDFWSERLRPGGLYLFHDYRPWLPMTRCYQPNQPGPHRFLAVESQVRKLRDEKNYRFLGSVRSWALLQKPL